MNIFKLKGAMISAGYKSIEDAAKAIGMKPATMYRRLKTGVFTNVEIAEMMSAYSIKDYSMFFPEEVLNGKEG